MSKTIYKTVIYCRLSKEDGDKVESNSIGGQRAYCEDYVAKQHDLQIVHEPIVDDGFSGVSFNRPGFLHLEEQINKGNINCIVVRDLSRFGRDYISTGRYLEKTFPQKGVRFIAINDNYDSLTSNPQSDAFILPFKNLINDTYCKDISVKIRSSLEIKQKNGDFVGNFCPYGYKRDTDNRHHLVPDDTAAETVQIIFSMFKDGFSIERIADRLNQTGVLSPLEYKRSNGVHLATVFKTKDVSKWTYNAVSRILSNDIYIGTLTQGKRGTPNYKVRIMQDKDESEWVKVEDTHEPLIRLDDFWAVQEMLKRDMRSAQDDEHIFSGFLFCGDCGGTMIRKTVPSKSKKYIYQVCSSNKYKKECTPHSISAKEVEEKVLTAIHDQVELVINLEQALALIADMPYQDRKALTYEKQIAQIEEEMARYQKLKLRLYEDFTDGVITREDYFEFRDSYTNILADKAQTKERLEREIKQAVATGTGERNWVTLFTEHENIDSLTRRVLMALVDRIIIHENHAIEIVFKYKDEFAATVDYVLSFEQASSQQTSLLEVVHKDEAPAIKIAI